MCRRFVALVLVAAALSMWAVSGAWARPAHKPMRTLAYPGSVLSLSFSRDGRMLAAAGGESIRIWDTSTWKVIGVITASASSVAFSADGRRVLVGGGDAGASTPAVWDIESGKVVQSLGTGPSSDVDVSPDGRLYGASSPQPAITWWDVAGPKHTGTIDATSPSFAFLRGRSTSGSRLVCEVDDRLVICDVRSGRVVRSLEKVGGIPADEALVAASSDGRTVAAIVTKGRRRFLDVWDVDSGRRRCRIRLREDVQEESLCLSPTGDRVYAGGDEVTGASGAALMYVEAWDVRSGRLVEKRYLRSGPTTVSVSPTGRVIVSAYGYNTVAVWDGRR